jgi:hypothetical protein
MKRSTKIGIGHREGSVPFYPAALPLSSQTLTYAAGVIRARPVLIATRPDDKDAKLDLEAGSSHLSIIGDLLYCSRNEP